MPTLSWLKFLPGYLIMIPYAGLLVGIIGFSLALRLIGRKETGWVHPEVEMVPSYCDGSLGIAS